MIVHCNTQLHLKYSLVAVEVEEEIEEVVLVEMKTSVESEVGE